MDNVHRQAIFQFMVTHSINTIEKTKKCWRIKINNEFIITDSGKTLWKELRHAKIALRMHFNRSKRSFISEYVQKSF